MDRCSPDTKTQPISPIWFANWNPYAQPKRRTMGGNGHGKLMTLSAPQMVTATPLTPGNCLKLPYSIRTKNLENLLRAANLTGVCHGIKCRKRDKDFLIPTQAGRFLSHHRAEVYQPPQNCHEEILKFFDHLYTFRYQQKKSLRVQPKSELIWFDRRGLNIT